MKLFFKRLWFLIILAPVVLFMTFVTGIEAIFINKEFDDKPWNPFK